MLHLNPVKKSNHRASSGSRGALFSLFFCADDVFSVNNGEVSREGQHKIVADFPWGKKSYVPDNLLVKMHDDWPVPLVVVEEDGEKYSRNINKKTILEAIASLALCNSCVAVTVFQDRLEVCRLTRYYDTISIREVQIPLVIWGEDRKPMLVFRTGFLKSIETILTCVLISLLNFDHCVPRRVECLKRHGKSYSFEFSKLLNSSFYNWMIIHFWLHDLVESYVSLWKNPPPPPKPWPNPDNDVRPFHWIGVFLFFVCTCRRNLWKVALTKNLGVSAEKTSSGFVCEYFQSGLCVNNFRKINIVQWSQKRFYVCAKFGFWRPHCLHRLGRGVV